jgi:cysteine synthase
VLIAHIRELIQNTPLLAAPRLATALGIPAGWALYLKLESENPGRSVKDRAGLALLEWLEEEGDQRLALESTSGNTGVGLALAKLGLPARIEVLVDTFIPRSKLNHMRLLGLEPEVIQLTGEEAATQSGVLIRVARIENRCCRQNGVVWLNQYANSAYPRWQSRTLAPEIFSCLPGTSLVAASVGTGGTISGIASYVQAHGLACRIAAVEPVGSAMFGHPPSRYQQRGSGNAFQTGNLWAELIDEFIQVADADAWRTQELTARTEGLFVGDSSGAAIIATARCILDSGIDRGIAVVIISDCGIRYLREPLRNKLPARASES